MKKDKAIFIGAAVGIIGIFGVFALRKLFTKTVHDDSEQIYQYQNGLREPEDSHGIEYYSVR